jgi:tetratricopeptide (TPR) repeat protein
LPQSINTPLSPLFIEGKKGRHIGNGKTDLSKVYTRYDLTSEETAILEDKMKRFFITLIFLLPFLILFTGTVRAQHGEKFFDVVGEIAYGEECLKTWQIDEASAIANKLLSTAAENPYVCFFAGEVRFYEGNYRESLSLLKKAQADHGITQNAREFYDFVDKIYQTTNKFKEVKTKHFLFRYVEDKDAILVDYALNTLEKAYHAIGNDLNFFPK